MQNHRVQQGIGTRRLDIHVRDEQSDGRLVTDVEQTATIKFDRISEVELSCDVRKMASPNIPRWDVAIESPDYSAAISWFTQLASVDRWRNRGWRRKSWLVRARDSAWGQSARPRIKKAPFLPVYLSA